MDIIVDPRFRDKIPKPTPEEYRQLEENILSDGEIREALVVWKGKNILIDGHNRWFIYQNHAEELPFPKISEREFEDENAAEDWMLLNQLGRRNLNEMQITALRGQLYKSRKKAVGEHKGNQYTAKTEGAQNEHIPSEKPKRVSEQLAEELGIGKETVKRAEHFLDGLDAADAAVPGFKDEILSGQTKAKQSDIAGLRKIDDIEERRAAVEAIKHPEQKPTGQKSLKEQIAYHTNPDNIPEYEAADLREDINAVLDGCLEKLHRIIDLHQDVATDNPKVVLAAIKEFESKMKEVKERVR